MGTMVPPPPDSVAGQQDVGSESAVACIRNLQITTAEQPGPRGDRQADAAQATAPLGMLGTCPDPTLSGKTTASGGEQLLQEEFREEEVDVAAVEEILGYTFRNPDLVTEALTHGSYHYPERHGISYERLEFVGDSILNCLVGRELYFMYPDLPPGNLTKLRAANVDTEKLGRAAVTSGLYRFLRHKAPYLKSQIEEFKKDMEMYPIHSNGLADVPKVLADIVESLLGAVYVDSDSLPIVWKIFKLLAEPLITIDMLGQHPVSELYELCQKRRMSIKFHDTWVQNTKINVLIDGNLIGSAAYEHKKEIAHNRAAKAALDRLKMILDQTQVEGEGLLDCED